MVQLAKTKGKGINLKIWIPIGAVALIIIIGLVFLMTSRTRVAFLNIEDGQVQVDEGSGWENAVDGMKLGLHDKVRTLNGKAIIILYESIIVQLDPETEVSIEALSKDKVKLNQETGTTWNKFASIAGIRNFEVETPNTVATVRGTSFWVDMTSVGVTEGSVDVKMQEKQMTITKGNKAVLREEVSKIEPLVKTEIVEAIAKKEVVVNVLKDLRQQELEKHRTTYEFVKKLRGWTDNDVTRYMDELDRGEYNEEELRQKVVLPAETVDNFAKITKEIRQQKAEINALSQAAGISAPETTTAPDRMAQQTEEAKTTDTRIATQEPTVQQAQMIPADSMTANVQQAEPTDTIEQKQLLARTIQ